MKIDLSRHPCFNDQVRHQYGRVHLPVAPKCNVQCNFCNRKFDCANESRPGVSSNILSPGQAVYYVEKVLEKNPRIAVVGIAGPGDPFANVSETLDTLRLIREQFPQMLLCVASNGLNVAPYAEFLSQVNVSHVTLTVNAVDPEIGAKVYAWIRDGKKVHRGIEAATILLNHQVEAIRKLKQHNITVKINNILIPGINSGHVEEVSRRMASLGADIFNCIPLYPVQDTAFQSIPSPTSVALFKARAEASQHLPQMSHCTRCRADAVGLLGEKESTIMQDILNESARQPLQPNQDRPYVAVASMEGVLVNQHLGEARDVKIYKQSGGQFELLETRETPPTGLGNKRWQDLADVLHDCKAILVSSAGDKPVNVLKEEGVQVVLMEGLIEEGLESIFHNKELRAPLRKAHRCGSGCSGDGMGCG